MNKSAWTMALVLVAGCTGNTISLDGEDTGGTDSESDSNSDTWPTTADSGDDGSSDDGPNECQTDSDCSLDCGWCDGGTCVEDFGCCSATPDEPSIWRCSPPYECWDDSECPDGEICDQGWGECIPDPNAGVRMPPTCDDLELTIEQFSVDAPLHQVAMHPGLSMVQGGLLAVDAEQQLVQVDPGTGALTPVAALPGTTVDLQAAGPDATLALTMSSDDGGDDVYQLSSVQRVDEAWSLLGGPETTGPVLDSAWLGDVTMVATLERLDRWAVTPAPAPLGDFPVDGLTEAIAPAQSTAEGPLLLGVLDTFGHLTVLDAASGTPTVNGISVLGNPVDLAAARDAWQGSGEDLVSLSSTFGGDEGEEQPIAVIQVFRNLEEIRVDEPFGALGRPVALAVADLDGDAIDDVVVALDDGRVQVFRMHETDVLCQSYVPLRSDLTDLEVGDVNGDGAPDVIMATSGSELTILHGRAGR